MKKFLCLAILVMVMVSANAFGAEKMIVHKNEIKYKLELETIKSLAIKLKSVAAGQFRMGNKCSIEDIYFDGEITHIKISCRKIWP
ncbi:hypothetical protein KAS41_00140 [Candidatus Parcubacteria bacterium]|nr:hypothetical protein [Candidatus Parcubacteria bacterium]